MDDSEKSYGYSEDIYHGRRPEKSYEYGAEGETGDAEGSDLAPEEEAIHIEGARNEEPQPAAETREYDYGRDDTDVESFTWENPPGEREPRDAEPVEAGRGESGSER
ncbi:MAG TPA: hypothetical protein VGX68_17365 [Thermoanaerobaculia bacterium]|jgi:hypothetical protein|nr:hypothetical protein [Thermoanaerobaculia bacterium]